MNYIDKRILQLIQKDYTKHEIIKELNITEQEFQERYNLIKSNFNNCLSDGVWDEYGIGEEDELLEHLRSHETNWPIADEEKLYKFIEYSDIYVYYTKDKTGRYTIPRIAMYKSRKDALRIVGRARDNTVEPEILHISNEMLRGLFGINTKAKGKSRQRSHLKQNN